MTAVSVVIETWNSRDLEAQLEVLAPQLGDAELVITHAGAIERARLEGLAGAPIVWVELGEQASYYQHKNRGFDASTGEIVAFLDADCEPSAGWLEAVTAPIAAGDARVVAGVTSYRGALAPLANRLDFPYFSLGRASVRNFFANNVAFAREVFAERRYPTIAPMFHGQCQVLGLQLLAAGIAIHLAPEARVLHAWPAGIADWLETRLLRGADTASLLPYVVAHYAPVASPIVARLGPAGALAVLAARAVTGTVAALRTGPRVRGLALVAGVTVVDAIGAAAAHAVYRHLDG